MKRDNGYPISPLIKIYIYSGRALVRLWSFLRLCFAGFWLGIFDREAFHSIDRFFYDTDTEGMFFSEAFNREGLFVWEEEALNKYFRRQGRLLVIGAGGGREVIALRKKGHGVDGFECNPKLVGFANGLLKKEGLEPDVKVVPRDKGPGLVGSYDGIIVGWGVYMLIRGRQQRIEFLKALRGGAKAGCPVLLSFFYRAVSEGRYARIARIANLIKALLGRKDLVEEGDDLHLRYIASSYVHYFTQDEVRGELESAGFRLDLYNTKHYAHAIGIASA